MNTKDRLSLLTIMGLVSGMSCGHGFDLKKQLYKNLGLPDNVDVEREYELIKQKKSKLSSRQRSAIVELYHAKQGEKDTHEYLK